MDLMMTSGAGHFDSLGNPSLKFHLCGIAHEEPGLEFEGIIDTGFTGFIMRTKQAYNKPKAARAAEARRSAASAPLTLPSPAPHWTSRPLRNVM